MVRLTPKPLEIEDYDGFTKENDIFDYAEFGDRLANLVCNLEDESLTIALDGPWGSGKSTFAKQWAGHLRLRGVPVIYFDAFAVDYHQDPFMALTEQIFAYTVACNNRTKSDTIKQSLGSAVSNLLPVAAKIGTRALTAGILDIELLREAGAAINAGADEAAKEAQIGVLSAIESRLNDAGAETKTMQNFQTQLAGLVEPLFTAAQSNEKATVKDSQTPNSPRLIFIIDELDRCRPDFAMGILETMKHCFGIKDIAFVLVTSTEHLKACYNHRYGDKSLAAKAVDKFVSLSVSLPGLDSGKHDQDRMRWQFINFLWESLEFSKLNFGQFLHPEQIMGHILEQAHRISLDLRQIKIYMANLAKAFSSYSTDRVYFAPIIVDLTLFSTFNKEIFSHVVKELSQHKPDIPQSVNVKFLEKQLGYSSDEKWAWLSYWDFSTNDQISKHSSDHKSASNDLLQFREAQNEDTYRYHILPTCLSIVTELADH